jgi:hypothetical protein
MIEPFLTMVGGVSILRAGAHLRHGLRAEAVEWS